MLQVTDCRKVVIFQIPTPTLPSLLLGPSFFISGITTNYNSSFNSKPHQKAIGNFTNQQSQLELERLSPKPTPIHIPYPHNSDSQAKSLLIILITNNQFILCKVCRYCVPCRYYIYLHAQLGIMYTTSNREERDRLSLITIFHIKTIGWNPNKDPI